MGLNELFANCILDSPPESVASMASDTVGEVVDSELFIAKDEITGTTESIVSARADCAARVCNSDVSGYCRCWYLYLYLRVCPDSDC